MVCYISVITQHRSSQPGCARRRVPADSSDTCAHPQGGNASARARRESVKKASSLGGGMGPQRARGDAAPASAAAAGSREVPAHTGRRGPGTPRRCDRRHGPVRPPLPGVPRRLQRGGRRGSRAPGGGGGQDWAAPTPPSPAASSGRRRAGPAGGAGAGGDPGAGRSRRGAAAGTGMGGGVGASLRPAAWVSTPISLRQPLGRPIPAVSRRSVPSSLPLRRAPCSPPSLSPGGAPPAPPGSSTSCLVTPFLTPLFLLRPNPWRLVPSR